jgi:hypothetical protein
MIMNRRPLSAGKMQLATATVPANWKRGLSAGLLVTIVNTLISLTVTQHCGNERVSWIVGFCCPRPRSVMTPVKRRIRRPAIPTSQALLSSTHRSVFLVRLENQSITSVLLPSPPPGLGFDFFFSYLFVQSHTYRAVLSGCHQTPLPRSQVKHCSVLQIHATSSALDIYRLQERCARSTKTSSNRQRRYQFSLSILSVPHRHFIDALEDLQHHFRSALASGQSRRSLRLRSAAA